MFSDRNKNFYGQTLVQKPTRGMDGEKRVYPTEAAVNNAREELEALMADKGIKGSMVRFFARNGGNANINRLMRVANGEPKVTYTPMTEIPGYSDCQDACLEQAGDVGGDDLGRMVV
jgi:hypothetical protein